MIPESVSEILFSLVTPAMGVTVAALIRAYIVVPARAVADIVHELVGPSLVVLVRMLAVLGVRKGKVAFSGWFKLVEFVDAVL